MENKNSLNKRYTLGEEIFNSVSHGVGIAFACAGGAVLIVLSAVYANALAVVSSSIFCATMILLYLASTLYHSISNPKVKEILRIFDHCSIFLLIAGTYTPFTLVSLGGMTGYIVFGIIWFCAIVGIVLNAISLEKFEKMSLALYLVMGWMVIFTLKPLINALSTLSLILLVVGGVMYTGGVFFYIKNKYRYMHSIWHLFVLAGTILHYFAILFNIMGM